MISSRDEATLAAAAAEVGEEAGANVEYRAADLSRAGEVEALVSHVTDRLGAWTSS